MAIFRSAPSTCGGRGKQRPYTPDRRRFAPFSIGSVSGNRTSQIALDAEEPTSHY